MAVFVSGSDESAGNKKPAEGWIFPAPTKSEHVEPSTLKKVHKKAITGSKVRPFVLYSLRHTFLTRLGESGCDVWTLARIAATVPSRCRADTFIQAQTRF